MALEMDDTTTVTSSPEQDKQKETPGQAGDDFIPLGGGGGDNDFIAFAASDAEDDEEGEDDEDASSFHPHRITLATFRRLLACYSTAVEQVYRRKMMVKMQPRPEKGSKAKAQKKAGSASANARGAALIQKTEFNASEERYIKTETESFVNLDCWRYETFPKIIVERKKAEGEKEKSDEGNGYLTKDELVSVMDWKTKHGLPRPMLMGMVRSNQVNLVRKSTAAALTALPTADPVLAPNDAFPKSSLDALTTPLRGVGTATASLILSIATAAGDTTYGVPFYSDDLYLWLCLKDFPEPESARKPKTLISGVEISAARPTPKISKYKRPNGELNVKYNLHEYRQLWNASQELRQRLNEEVEAASSEDDKDENESEASAQPVSHIDIEKVAFVLRYIAVSGYYPDQDPEAILQTNTTELQPQPNSSAGGGASSEQKTGSGKKRKRKEKDDGSKEESAAHDKKSKKCKTKADKGNSANGQSAPEKKEKEQGEV